MRISIITTGKKPDAAHQTIEQEYIKRLGAWAQVDWRLLPPGKSMDDESIKLLEALKPDDFVVLLDERGQQVTNEVMATHLEKWLVAGRHLVFVIGGAYGVNNAVRGRADYIWSFSALVFPHQLMRLLLTEQLYRLFSLRAGSKYHHGS